MVRKRSGTGTDIIIEIV